MWAGGEISQVTSGKEGGLMAGRAVRTPALESRAKDMRRGGSSFSAIARELGVSASAVRRWIVPGAREDHCKHAKEYHRREKDKVRETKRRITFVHTRKGPHEKTSLHQLPDDKRQ